MPPASGDEVAPKEDQDGYVMVSPPAPEKEKELLSVEDDSSKSPLTSQSAAPTTDTSDSDLLRSFDVVHQKREEEIKNDQEEVQPEQLDQSLLSQEEWDELRVKARKAGVAVAGGSLLAAGVVLAPFPTPVGEAMVVGGVGVLATEFPAAQRVIDGAKEKVASFIDSLPDEDDDDDDKETEGEEEEKEEAKKSTTQQREANLCKHIKDRELAGEGDILDMHYQTMKDTALSVKKKAIKLGKSVRPHLEPDAEMPSVNVDMDAAGEKVKRSIKQMQDQMLQVSEKYNLGESIRSLQLQHQKTMEQMEQLYRNEYGKPTSRESNESDCALPTPPRF